MYFLSSSFLVSLLLGLLTFIMLSIFKKQNKIELKNICAGIILGLLNFGSTYYFLICLGILNTTVFFPVFNASIVLSAALIGYFIFNEKLSFINWIGIVISLIAITLITIF